MSLSKKVSQSNDKSIDFSSKATALNPNAAEFVPFSLRSPGSTSNPTDAAPTSRFTTSGVALHRSESSVSNASDDEAHRFWRHQLPDDITPDFKVTSEDDSHGYEDLSFAGLSLNDGSKASSFSTFAGSGYGFSAQQEPSPHHGNGGGYSDKMRFAASSYVEDPNAANLLHFSTKPWDNTDQLLGNGREMNTYSENSRQGFVNDILSEQAMMDGTEMNPLEFLASQFPGFASESLAEVYFANGCDLNLTIEMLTQLELQVEGGFSQSMNSKTLSAPNLNAMEFPALSMQESQTGTSKYARDDIQQSINSYQSPEKENLLLFKSGASFPSRGATDFASAVRKMALQDSNVWKYERNGPADSTVGSSRSSNVLASAYSSGQGRGVYADRAQNRSSSRAAPSWLETGEAVGNLYTEMREEARDHARMRNAYFEQARQAYLIGNKALAKELSGKGQLHNVQMKAAHGKAQDSIYRQRNQGGVDGRGNERMIDLHGLHVSEALHVLRQELGVLRSTARAADQRLQVYICVGTGHHTRGTRTPARLPIAVQRYLLEEEGLDYSEPQPGLLRVVIY
ncbi:Polyadenylate-binding protein-interacting protein 7 [Linum perenne]